MELVAAENKHAPILLQIKRHVAVVEVLASCNTLFGLHNHTSATHDHLGVRDTLTPFAEEQVAPMHSVHGSESLLTRDENSCTKRTVV